MPPKIFDNYEDALAYLEKLYNQTMVGNPKRQMKLKKLLKQRKQNQKNKQDKQRKLLED